MSKLYHGTLARNVESIRKIGLAPQKGLWMGNFHSDAAELIFAAGEHERHRLVLAITGQMAKANLVPWADSYEFEHFKTDLLNHGAVVEVGITTFCRYPPGRFAIGHPSGTEPGDWYSRESIGVDSIHGIVTGQEMLDLLKPSPTEFAYTYRDVLRRHCPPN